MLAGNGHDSALKPKTTYRILGVRVSQPVYHIHAKGYTRCKILHKIQIILKYFGMWIKAGTFLSGQKRV